MDTSTNKSRKAPDALLIILVVLALAVASTWLVPAGSFDRAEVKTEVGMRNAVVPGTYHAVDATPVPWWGFFTAPVKGLADHQAAMIIAFVLLIGGAFAVLNATGAIDAGLYRVLRRRKAARAESMWSSPCSCSLSASGATPLAWPKKCSFSS